MFQRVIFFIALRYMYRKTKNQFGRCIYWFSSVTVMLGVMILVIVLSVMNGFERNLKENVLYFTPHIFLTTANGYTHIDNVPNFDREELCNVKYIQPLVISDVILQSVKKISLGSMLGIDPNCCKLLSNCLINNKSNQLVAGKYYVVLGSNLARYLEVNINDKIRLIIPAVTQMTPIGYIPSQRLFTVSDIYVTNGDVDDYQVLIHQFDASNLMRYPSKNYITGWRLWLYDPFIIDDFFYQSLLSNNWVWKDWKDYKGSVFQAMKIEKSIMSFLLSLIVLAACFNIMSFLILLVMDKQKEIAILKTYGFSRAHIILIFIIQGISNGILGMIFGIGLGVFLSKQLNKILFFFNILPNNLQLPIEIQVHQVLIIVIMTFITILLTTLYPAWYASSILPAKVLRYG